MFRKIRLWSEADTSGMAAVARVQRASSADDSETRQIRWMSECEKRSVLARTGASLLNRVLGDRRVLLSRT
jgi:hypothetical protein